MHKSWLLLAVAASFLLAQSPTVDPDEKSLKDALDKVKSSPADSAQFAKAYRDLGEFYCSQSRYAEAEPLFAKLLEEREHAFGLNSADIVPEVAELARVLAPGGVLAVTVPAGPGRMTATDRSVGHLRRYDAA